MSLRLGIVIVHFNTPADLARCLESLRAEARSCPHEIVVVDNASNEPGLAELCERFSEVRWLRNTENLGYGRGCNQGMAALPADYHLILNPDIVVLPGALTALLDFAEKHPRAGLIGSQLLNEDGSIQESCRRFYTFKTLLLRRTILGKLFPRSETVRRHLMCDFDHASTRSVDWVLGGCMLVRREARNRCGPMDERFFLYFEDVDWCYRMWQCGFEVQYFPGARFVHRHRRSSAQGRFSRSFWLHLGSLIAFYEKWSLVVYAAKKWRRPLAIALYWLLDMALLAIALLGSYGLRRLLQTFFPEELLPLSWYRAWFAYAAVLVTVTFVMMGRYQSSHLRRGQTIGAHIKQMVLVALLLLSGSYLGRQEVVSRAVLLMLLCFYTGLAIWAAEIISRLNRRLETGYFALERTLLAGPVAPLAGWLTASNNLHLDGIDLVGYVTDDPAPASGHPALGAGRLPWLGAQAALPQLVQRFRVSQVVFWQHPGSEPGLCDLLAMLRYLRIRLRWTLPEAWLLATGARAEVFGAASSGVLDPDDGGSLRRLALRPIEIMLALLLLPLAMGILVWPRRMKLRNGTIRQEWVDESPRPNDLGRVDVLVHCHGKPMPLWWQTTLLKGLLTGRIKLWGRPLVWDPSAEPVADAGAGTDPDPSLPWLRGDAVMRPALTGFWFRGKKSLKGAAAFALKGLFLNPGGWPPAADIEVSRDHRDFGREVDRT